MSQISPRVDIAFKKIFGVEENKDLLISLINAIVAQEDQVEEVTLLNPYNPKSFKDDKSSILDIKAKGTSGKRFNIEIQISKKALNVLDVMSFGDEEREAYEGHLKWLRIEANTLKKYETKGFSEGWDKGIAKGKAEGIAEGAKHAAAQIAQNVLSQGMNIQQVQAITGLSIQEIGSL